MHKRIEPGLKVEAIPSLHLVNHLMGVKGQRMCGIPRNRSCAFRLTHSFLFHISQELRFCFHISVVGTLRSEGSHTLVQLYHGYFVPD